jgi:hypothetical protein
MLAQSEVSGGDARVYPVGSELLAASAEASEERGILTIAKLQ